MSDLTKKKSFGLGYSLIVQSLLSFWVFGAWSTAMLNLMTGAFSAKNGWDSSVMLTLSSVGGVLAIFGAIAFSQWVMKKGPRPVISISLIITGLAVIWVGNTKSIAVFGICMALFHIMGQGYCTIGGGALIGNWFPKRKGFMLGITTAGLPAAPFLFLPLANACINKMGLTPAFNLLGACVVVFGIISFFWVRNKPADVGLLPENGKYPDVAQYAEAKESKWTIKDLLVSKNVWLVGLAFGGMLLLSQGIVSQVIPYLIQAGYQQPSAVKMLSYTAAGGIAGSFISGIIDDKFGTKKTAIFYEILFIITCVLLWAPGGKTTAIIGLVFLGCVLGVPGNMLPSMLMTVFGPSEFASVNRVANTIASVIRGLGFAVMAVGLKIDGTYRSAMIPFLVIAIVILVLIFFIDKKELNGPVKK